MGIPVRSLRTVCIVLVSLAVTSGHANPGDYLDGTIDSLSIVPRPLLGFEDGAARIGIQASVLKILAPTAGRFLYPFLESGIAYFSRVNASPNDKKQLFLNLGLLGSFTETAVCLDFGVRYGNGRMAPAFGLGGWWFLSGHAREEKKPEDFPTHAAWLAWKAAAEAARGPFSASALALRIHWAPRLEPGFVIGLSLELFL